MICQPCARSADVAATVEKLFDQGDGYAHAHDPAICRDRDIQPHGCACAHGHPVKCNGCGASDTPLHEGLCAICTHTRAGNHDLAEQEAGQALPTWED